MSDLSLAAAQTAYAVRGFLRNKRSLVFTVIMPVFLLLLFNSVFSGKGTKFSGIEGSTPSYYTASIVSYQVMLAGFGSLLISVTTEREAGRLKRFRGTPMPSWVYLAAQMAQTLVVVAATVFVLVAVGALFYSVKLSAHTLLGLVVYVILGTASSCALGLAVARICTTTDTATAVGPFATVILAFVSGVFIPVAALPAWLLDVGKVFPLEHLARGLQTAFLVRGSTGISTADVAVIVGWGLAGMVVAVGTFSWEPLAAGSA